MGADALAWNGSSVLWTGGVQLPKRKNGGSGLALAAVDTT